MNRFIHAPVCTAFSGNELTLSVLIRTDGAKKAPVFVTYESAVRERTQRMRATDTHGDYTLYSYTLTADEVRGKEIIYSFGQDGVDSRIYTVPIMDMPALPPFVITEFASEMRNEAHFYELCNPRGESVDLFDYEILLEKDGVIVGRNPLADAKRTNVLKAGEVAVLRFLAAESLAEHGSADKDVRAMLRALADAFPDCEKYVRRAPRVMTVHLAKKSKDGYAPLKGTFPVTQNDPHRLLVVPRGKGADAAVYVMRVNCDKDERDVPARTVSLWTVDFSDPSHPFRIDTRRPATPGALDVGQVFPRVGNPETPAILPLSPVGECVVEGTHLPLRFAVLGGNVGVVRVHIVTPDGTRELTPVQKEDGTYEASVPVKILRADPRTLSYWIEARSETYHATLGNENNPQTVSLIDRSGPIVSRLYPADGQTLGVSDALDVTVRFWDLSGVDVKGTSLFFDGRNVSDGSKWRKNSVTYTPPMPLSEGEHVIEMTLRDLLGNRSYLRSAFRVSADRPNLYRGEVHAHTLDSDGSGTPEEAMAYARDVGKVDYFAVTDHCCYLVQEDIDRQKAVADSFNVDGKFAALYGYEVSWGNKEFYGHMNVLGAPWFAAADKHSLYDIYDKLTADPFALAMFNHPIDRWGDFNSFGGYTRERDARVALAEIKRAEFDNHYALALARGWHVAPVSNEDNHKKDWTTRTTGTGVALAYELTRDNIMDAFRRGRTYSTMDNTMKIWYRVNGEWLGSRLQNPKQLIAEVEISTEREEGIGVVELVSEDNIVVARAVAGLRRRFAWRVELAPDFDYYYIRVRNGDTYTVTSPVYVEGRDAVSIVDMKGGVSKDPTRPHAVSVTVQNTGTADLVGVMVTMYLTPVEGFAIREQTSNKTILIDKLKVGETRTVNAYFPNVEGARRVSAVVEGQVGRNRYADTHFLLLTPALITKVLPLTSPHNGVENPFAYAELYNHTEAPLSLDGYCLNARHVTGDHNPTVRLCRVIIPLDGFVIPPHETLVVWQRPVGSKLTVDDFNARYGTSFEEGKDLLITEKPMLVADRVGHTLDLCFGEEHLTRAAYGTYCGGALPRVDVPDQYRYASDMTIRELRFAQSAATPGRVMKMQTVHTVAGTSRRKAADRVMAVTDLTKTPLTLVQRVEQKKPTPTPAQKKPSALQVILGAIPTTKNNSKNNKKK